MALPVPLGATAAAGIGLTTVAADAVAVHVDAVSVVVDHALPGTAPVAVVNGDVLIGVLLLAGSLDVDVAEPDSLCERGSDLLRRRGDGRSDEECGAEDGGEDGGGVEHHFDG